MHFEVLGRERRHSCSVELVMADMIEIKRKPNQVFTFKNVSNFVDALIGHRSTVVHVGRDAETQEEAEKAGVDTDKWVAYYWEKPSDDKGGYGYSGGESILPPGSLAKLEMDNQFEVEWELDLRQTQARKWVDLWAQVQSFCHKIGKIDRENKYSDEDQFRYMSREELEKVLEQIKAEYEGLTHKKKAEV